MITVFSRRKTKKYDVKEFDKPNPSQKLRDGLSQLQKMVDGGHKDKMIKQMRKMGEHEMADLVGVMEPNSNYGLGFDDMVIEMVNAGDLDKALAAIDKKEAEGDLSPAWARSCRITACEFAGDMEGELRALDTDEAALHSTRYSHKADLLYRLGRIEELEEMCKAWEGMNHSRSDLYLNKARLMHAKGDRAGTQRQINAILVLDDFVSEAYELWGDILADAGDFGDAIKQYNRALDKDYNTIYFHIKKAEALMRMGRPDSAALACRRGLDVRPQNKRLRHILNEAGG